MVTQKIAAVLAARGKYRNKNGLGMPMRLWTGDHYKDLPSSRRTHKKLRLHWRAAICFKRKHYSLGGYHNFEDTVRACKRAEENLYETFLREFTYVQIQSANG